MTVCVRHDELNARRAQRRHGGWDEGRDKEENSHEMSSEGKEGGKEAQ